MDFPKVLILNQPFTYETGGGITLTNLFAGWPSEKVAVVCQSYLLKNSNTDICKRYYQLGHKEHKFMFPLNLIKRKHYSGPIDLNEYKIGVPDKPKSKFRNKLIFRFLNPLLKYSGLSNGISKTKLSNALCKWLDEFNPEVIYAQASSRESIIFILLVHSYLKKPLVFHMMDDWISSANNSGLSKYYWQKITDRDFRLLLSESKLLLSISDAMADEYKMRYNKNFITFHNPINIDFWRKHQKTNYDLNSYASILYAGRIGLGIQSSLETIAKAIQSVNEQLNMSIKLILQTTEKPDWVNNYSCTEYKNLVNYNDLPKTFSEADFLILPYDFTRDSIKYIQYSMPTKTSEYMISGTPIIVFAPEITAVVKYAKKYNWAKLVVNNSIVDISTAIKELIQNKSIREGISKNAIKIAVEKHDSIVVTKYFKSLMSSLITDQQ